MGTNFALWQLYSVLCIMCIFYGPIEASLLTTEQTPNSSTVSASISTDQDSSFFHQEKGTSFKITPSPSPTRPFNSSLKEENIEYLKATTISDPVNTTTEDSSSVTENGLTTPVSVNLVTSSVNWTVSPSRKLEAALETFTTEKSNQYYSTEIKSSPTSESQNSADATDDPVVGKQFCLEFESSNGTCVENFTDSSMSRKIEEYFITTVNVSLSMISLDCKNNSLHVVVLSKSNLVHVFNNSNLNFHILYKGIKYNLIFYKVIESHEITTVGTSDSVSDTISVGTEDVVHTTGGSSKESIVENSGSNASFWHKLSELERILIIIGGVLGISLFLFILILSCHTLRYRKHTQSFNLGKTSIHIEVGPQDYVLEKLERPKILYNLDGSIVYESTGNMDPPVPNPSPCFNHQLRYSSQKEDQRLHRSRLELTQDIDEFDNESTLSQLERKLMLKDLKVQMNGIDNPIFVKDDPILPSENKRENNPDVDTQSNDSGVDGSSYGSSLRKNSKGKL